MPNSSPTSSTNWAVAKQLHAATSLWLSACLLLAVACTSSAQTLAKPGWTASGLNADPWWKHAIFYEVKPSMTAIAYEKGDTPPPSAMDWVNNSQAIATKLEALQSLGVDAVILPMPFQQDSQAPNDNFDELMRQASQRGVHILLDFPVYGSSVDLAARARQWLTRGVSGFYVARPSGEGTSDSQTVVPMLRKIASTEVGGRIVIADLSSGPAGGSGISISQYRGRSGFATASSGRTTDQTGAQLQVDAREALPSVPDAAALRRVLQQEPMATTLLVDLQQPANSSNSSDAYAPLWRTIAAISLTTHPVALIDADAQLSNPADAPSAEALDWYRRLIALHRSNATLRYGSATLLDFDAQNALVWVSRASAGTGLAAPVVVACNLSASPIQLNLSQAVKGLGLHGSFMLTLLRADQGMGPQGLDAVTLPPFGVYVGELHR